LLQRGPELLIVKSLYTADRLPLWTLPGGRQEEGESIAQTVVREFNEETSLGVDVVRLAYVSESVDRPNDLHVVNCTFWMSESDASAPPRPNDPKIAEVRFAPAAAAIELLRADVLRIPVTAALLGADGVPYYWFDSDTVAVPFFPSPYRRPE
jgi:ADP-ribose pyrophosphatase YjhB (NUDIX family)